MGKKYCQFAKDTFEEGGLLNGDSMLLEVSMAWVAPLRASAMLAETLDAPRLWRNRTMKVFPKEEMSFQKQATYNHTNWAARGQDDRQGAQDDRGDSLDFDNETRIPR